MGKIDKERDIRMGGILYAYHVAKKDGIEALEKDIKMRGLTQIPITVPKEECERVYKLLTTNIYNNMLVGTMVALKEAFGFGEQRLKKWQQAFKSAVDATFDLDTMGEQYVSMTDYATELIDKYHINEIDLESVEDNQNSYNEGRQDFRVIKIDGIIQLLSEKGFKDAADYIKWLTDKEDC